MFYVIIILLTFHSGEQFTREYKLKTFNDTWACWEYLTEKKVELVTPHLEAFTPDLKSFQFYCESRYGEEV